MAKEAPGRTTAGDLTLAMFEVLACIAFKQPISQSRNPSDFRGLEKRAFIARWWEMELVTEFTGPGGLLQLATTEVFLRHFKISSADELAGLM